jgi:transcription elongation factor Elf1
MGKLKTPEWILEGYSSREEWEKDQEKKSGKKQKGNFKLKCCPKCGSLEVSVILVGEEGKKADMWECKKCKWKGKNIDEKFFSEEEYLKLLEK